MLTTGMGLGAPPGCLQGVQTEVEMESTGATEIYMGRDVAPRSFAWVVPVSSDRCRVGLTTARDATSYLKKLLSSPLLRHRVRSGSPVIQASTIPVGLIPRSSAPRVLVVGEAAGQVKTTTGGGIYYGLLCSEILEEVVVASFHSGDPGCETLMDYERKWKEKIGSELRMGWFLRQVGGKLKDSHLDALIEIANRDGIMPIVYNMAHFDWHRDLIFSVFKHLFYNGGLRSISLTAR
jgi:flavin-dependent dehydrogenase